MTPRDHYRRLMWGIQDAEIRCVAAVMAEHIGEANAVTMPELRGRVSMSERKVRAILERLTKEFGIPIGAQSGKAGRFIISNEFERQAVIADLASRVGETQARIKALREIELPVDEPEHPHKTAPTLFEMPEPQADPLAYWRR